MAERFLDRLERRLRAGLGLPEDPDQGVFEGPNERGLYTFREQPEEEQEASFRHYHEQPLLGHILDEGFRYLNILSGYVGDPDRLLRRVSWPLRRLLLENELADARTIRWESWHKGTPGEITHLDGYVLLPSGERFPLDIQALGEQEVWARESWQDGGVMIRGRGARTVETVVCPVEALTPAVVEQAVRRWYMERFEWRRGHWAVVERRLPHFEVETSFWEQPEDPQERARYKRKAAKIDTTVAKLPRSEWSARLERRYGLTD